MGATLRGVRLGGFVGLGLGVMTALALFLAGCGILSDEVAPDGGGRDGSAADAGVVDGGAPDAGSADAGRLDAGSSDGGRTDGGGTDGGTGDAGPIDGGPADGGPADAGSPDGGGGPIDRCPSPLPTGTVRLEPSCPFSACGGAFEGVWTYADVCFTPKELFSGLDCPDLVITLQDGSVQGCLAAEAGAVVDTYELRARLQIEVPMSCWPQQCAGLQQLLALVYPAITCREPPGGSCVCELPITMSGGGSDTYQTSGTTLTLGDGSIYGYCATANRLSLKEVGPDAEPGVRTLQR